MIDDLTGIGFQCRYGDFWGYFDMIEFKARNTMIIKFQWNGCGISNPSRVPETFATLIDSLRYSAFIQNEMLAMYAAIYCVREFDEEKAKYLAKQYLDAPCLEVMSAGTFFHASILSLETGLTMNYLRRNIPMKKSKPGLKALMKRLGFTRPSIMWRAMWDTMTKKSSSGA